VKVISILCANMEILKSHFKWMYGDLPYKMALIIITKRINSRLLLNGGNPPQALLLMTVLPCQRDMISTLCPGPFISPL